MSSTQPSLSHRRKNRGRRGTEIMEFTLVMLPMFILVFILLDIGWQLFAHSTLQQAVRLGARYGVTNQPVGGSTVTEEVKTRVQQNALGLLRGDANRARIRVRYYESPNPSTGGTLVEVTGTPNCNKSDNVLVVSVENFSFLPLVPRVFGWNSAADNSATLITASSADRIEPTSMGSLPKAY